MMWRHGCLTSIALTLGLWGLLSCKHSGGGGSAQSHAWDATGTRQALSACIDAYKQMTNLDVTKTCSCVVNVAKGRWSASHYLADEPTLRESLIADFSVGRCMGWDESQLASFVNQCVIQTRSELADVDAASAEKACRCQYVDAASKWAHEDFEAHKDEFNSALKRDGVITSCRAQAGMARKWRQPQLLEDDNTGNVAFPKLVMTSRDEGLALWAQFDGQRQNITAARYVGGSGWQEAVNLEPQNSGSSGAPDIAVDNYGRALAVWSRYGGGGKNIWASHFDGSKWRDAVLIEDDKVVCPDNDCTDGQWRPARVASDSFGNGMAVWPARDSLWTNRFGAASGKWMGAQKIADNGREPDVAFNTKGQAVVVWAEKNVHVRTWDPDGSWSAVLTLDPDNLNETPIEPKIAFDLSGKGVVAWLTGATEHRLWAAYHDPDKGWGKPVQIDDGEGDSGAHEIAIDSKGSVILVWHQKKGETRDVWMSRTIDGTVWDKAKALGDGRRGSAFQPRIGTDSNGQALVVWNFHNGVNWDVLFSQFDGTHWSAPDNIFRSTGANRIEPQVGFDRHGQGICVWYEEDGVRSMWGSILQ